MLSDQLKAQIKGLWNKFWSRGITNPINAIEQISYLLFMRRIDETDVIEQDRATQARQEFQSIFIGNEECRWSYFSTLEPPEMLDIVANRAFPFIKNLNHPSQPYSRHMENANFIINNPTLLTEAVNIINEIYDQIKIQQEEGQQFQDTQGDVYEYLLDEIGSAGKNGQFRTPRHLIQFMCELIDPDYNDTICDPACGTGGFLLGAYQHILAKHTTDDEIIRDENGFKRYRRFGGNKITDLEIWNKLNERTFFGFDIDQTMVRTGLMNLMLHGIKIPQIENIDTLSENYEHLYPDTRYSVVMANPPFTGKIDDAGMSEELKTAGTQSELLFLLRISKMLQSEGKAAVIIPEGVLFGTSKAHKETKKVLLRDNRLEAVISLPAGVFKPYAGVKTSILVFTKIEDNSQVWHTEKVWFYELKSDGYSLDDNRKKLSENPLPDARDAYMERVENTPEERIDHFYVKIDEIKDNKLDLRYISYKKFVYEEPNYEPPQQILKALLQLEEEIRKDMEDLNNMIE